jgi:hypothetical protein
MGRGWGQEGDLGALARLASRGMAGGSEREIAGAAYTR